MTILVTGSRSLTDQRLIDQACDTFIFESGKRGLSGFNCLKHGAAAGVDTLAAKWAKRHGIEPVPFPAKWHIYGKSAGFKRNQEMIDSGFDVMLAIRCFGKSNGTDHCIQQAKLTGKPIFLYKENGTYEWLQ
jgi:hypothetical protein